ncbi:unnamed protein product [Parascedosporium putredinis]|uniref:Delta 8-(E)-sphingolipid desaturase n=1 Tax=Parascedosporium putredinis TaxID=1442378 RepID=A0A9P1GY58_9PEZI|nr:unnamed protein product [Parascedosporium putredinis]CAI7989631.1 unnamed protein product [Parascedosporium putredinis]
MNRDKVLSPGAIDDLIADGQKIVIMDEYVLKLDGWLDRHPGGRLVILHMVGKDATDEIHAYHSLATLKTMKALRIGRKPPGVWLNRTPPIRGGVFVKRAGSIAASDSGLSSDAEVGSVSADESGSAYSQIGSDADPELSSATSLSSEGSDAEEHVRVKATGLAPPTGGVARKRTAPKSNGDGVVDGVGEKIRSVEGVEAVVPTLASDGSEAPEGTGKHAYSQPRFTADGYTAWAVRQEIDKDSAIYPSVDPAVQQKIITKYQALHQRVHEEGHYECRYIEYGKEMARYSTLFGAFLVALYFKWYMTSATFLGLFWHQIMFTAHDAGHLAITQNFVADTLIGMFIADFCCGLSIGWWKSSHNVHHLLTNHPEHDPDIQNVPLFATSPAFFGSLRSSYYDFVFLWDAAANFLVPLQQYTYYPVLAIARFNLYILSWGHVLSDRSTALGKSRAWWIRPTEISFMAIYWFLFGYLLLWRALPTWTIRVAFVLVSHIVPMPLHIQINLSHWGMSHSDLGESESFPQRQLRTTMDVDCPAWLDFIHGGLQFQAIHHLFPACPATTSAFMDGNKKVLGRLGDISDQVKILVDCQNYMAENNEMGLH